MKRRALFRKIQGFFVKEFMKHHKENDQIWDKVAELYQEKFMGFELYDDTYDLFCSLIHKEPARVLDIGCGPGNITSYLASKRPGWTIHAIDSSQRMIQLAKKNCPTVQFEVMDCRDLKKIKGKFDGIINGFTSPYLSKQKLIKFIQDCYCLMETGAIFYLSTIEGDSEFSQYETNSFGDSVLVHYYSERYLKHALQEHGFKIKHLIRKEYCKSDGEVSSHLILIGEKS